MGPSKVSVTQILSHNKKFVFDKKSYLVSKVASHPDFKLNINFYRKQTESAPLSVPPGPSAGRRHAGLHLVGGPRARHLSVLLQTQGDSRRPLGPAEGQPQENDLPEDGQGPAQLRQDRRGQKGQEEAHVPVQQRGDEEDAYGQETVSSLTFPLDPVSLTYNIHKFSPAAKNIISGICNMYS